MKESWARRSAPDKRTADVQCEKKALGSSNSEGTGLTDRGNAPSLSQPLSEEERNKLIEEHMKLVRPLAMGILNRYTLPFDMLGEMEADGRLGLVGAARRYQPREGGSFGAYANAWIRGRILGGLKHAGLLRENWRKKEIEPAYSGKERFADGLGISEQKLQQLLNHLDKLTEKQATAAVARFKHHKSLGQIGKEMGVSRASVKSTLQGAAVKLKWILSPNYNFKSARKQRNGMVINKVRAAIPLHMSLPDLALEVGLSNCFFQRIVKCKNVPSIAVALLLARKLGKRVEDLFELNDGTSPEGGGGKES